MKSGEGRKGTNDRGQAPEPPDERQTTDDRREGGKGGTEGEKQINCRMGIQQNDEQKNNKLPDELTKQRKFARIRLMKTYAKRIADGLLERKLQGMGAVLVQGAKWCGKTTTCEQIARSALYMGDPVKRRERLEMASIEPDR